MSKRRHIHGSGGTSIKFKIRDRDEDYSTSYQNRMEIDNPNIDFHSFDIDRTMLINAEEIQINSDFLPRVERLNNKVHKEVQPVKKRTRKYEEIQKSIDYLFPLPM